MPTTMANGLCAQFEDAALARARLADAFDALATLAGGTTALMFSLLDGRPGIIGGAVASELQSVYHQQNWKSSDVLTARVRALAPDVVLFAQDFLPAQLIESSAFFQTYLAAFDILWGAGWVFDLDDERWALAIARSRTQGPFHPEDKDLLSRAAPRITRCLALLNANAHAHAKGVCDALDTRGRPYIVLDHMGLVSHVSARALSILDNDALCLRESRLVSSDPAANDILQSISTSAKFGALGAVNVATAPLAEFFIKRTDRSPVMLSPVRLRAPPLDVLPGAQILLRLSDLEHHPTPRAEPLKALFGLSPREIEIAQRIAVGEEPATIAAALGLQTSSVRQVVKSILVKTGRRRFGQLVALFSRLPDMH